MVPGIDSFREKFKDYTDYYTIIGGTACDILLSEADLPFRATKDIDMILIMEDNFPEFAAIFWEYIKEGGYKCGWKNEENMHFYRFTEGQFGYPTMIELLLSVKLDAPAPCRLDAPDLDLICYASADCLHQHLQVI